MTRSKLIDTTYLRAYLFILCVIAALLVASVALAVPVPIGPPEGESLAAADPPAGSFEYGPIGTPLGTGKLKIDVTVVIKGKKVTKEVVIEAGTADKPTIVPFVRPKIMRNDKGEIIEEFKDFAKRISDARGEASQAKAKVIADAINEVFKKEFEAEKVKAGVGIAFDPRKDTIRVGVVDFKLDTPYGAVVLPLVSKDLLDPIKFTEGRILGEGGNRGRFLEGAKPSPGMKGSLERSQPGVTTVATGLDPLDEPSLVEFGIGDNVASLTPSPGMTDEDVLAGLESLLRSQGLSATFDRSLMALFLDSAIPDGLSLVWGNTDTGLEFVTTMRGLQSAPSEPVPEPQPALLALIGLLGWTAVGRRGRPKT